VIGQFHLGEFRRAIFAPPAFVADVDRWVRSRPGFAGWSVECEPALRDDQCLVFDAAGRMTFVRVVRFRLVQGGKS